MDPKRYMISLVVPVYNEEAVLELSFERMNAVLQQMKCRYEIIYIDDGSKDNTWQIVEQICRKEKRVKGLRFARNFGHQLAVTAGMDEAKGDAIVVIDADLQDPPELIPQMVEKWLEGYEVVYGKRLKREGETIFKKFTAFVYYRLLKAMSAYPIPLDTGDFRLLDRKVADVMGSMREHNRFLRGMSSWAGFRQCPVEYVRQERAAGKTKYTLKKMVKLALDGILGFSAKPVTLAFGCGLGVMGLTGLGMIALLVYQIIRGFVLMPWMIALLFLLGGGILTAMGTLGAYVARIYDEVQNRPLYVISERRRGWSENRPERRGADRAGGEKRQKQEGQLREREAGGEEERRGSRNSRRRKRKPVGQGDPVKEEALETGKDRESDGQRTFQTESAEKSERIEKREAVQTFGEVPEGKTVQPQRSDAEASFAKSAEKEIPAFETHLSMAGVEQRNGLMEK